ncbi:MAG TPA: excinuclease ABC subunit C [Terracidiphilus sp.]|nr:excinuclease ABC subunit C [Terracidiphilus sp.]
MRNLRQSVPFNPAEPKAALAQLPALAAVFALYGADERAEPYVGRTPNLRARLARLLQPSPKHPRRLQLAGLVRRIEFQLTGSEFESLLAQFNLLHEVYGQKSLEIMHLRAPAFVRFLGSNRYPRVVVTHRPSQREGEWAYGPFASRAAAERYVEEALKLFLLRRCVEELDPNPAHPGCVYSEMKMCLAPCYQGCTDERYAEEAVAVEQFLATRGERQLVTLRAQRDEASASLAFESAAALHAQVQRAEAVRALAPEMVRPQSRLRAIVLQPSTNPAEVSVFVFDRGRLAGPAAFSTMGMRIQNEQSGSSSLFAQPVAVEAIPEVAEAGTEADAPAAPIRIPRGVLEARLEEALALVAEEREPSAAVRQGHLALLKRWYYRPETRRSGEIFFPDEDDAWPLKAVLRGIGRVAVKAMQLAQNP